MKVKKTVKEIRTVTLRIAESTMQKIDALAKEHDSSRQELIEQILETAIADQDFEIEISTVKER